MRRKIRILWSKPILVEDAISDDTSLNNRLYFNEHETSLYIGMASNTIKKRLRDHIKDWLYRYRGKKHVRIGQIIYPKEYNRDLIYDAESALIYEHGKKILKDNTDKLNSYHYANLYDIENSGDYFELKQHFSIYDHRDC